MDARWWPVALDVREERLLTAHIFVSLLKAWKVTVEGIECDDTAFNIISRRPTPEIVLPRKKLFFPPNSASKLAKWTMYLY